MMIASNWSWTTCLAKSNLCSYLMIILSSYLSPPHMKFFNWVEQLLHPHFFNAFHSTKSIAFNCFWISNKCHGQQNDLYHVSTLGLKICSKLVFTDSLLTSVRGSLLVCSTYQLLQHQIRFFWINLSRSL